MLKNSEITHLIYYTTLFRGWYPLNLLFLVESVAFSLPSDTICYRKVYETPPSQTFLAKPQHIAGWHASGQFVKM
jgi:hypothetical protein